MLCGSRRVSDMAFVSHAGLGVRAMDATGQAVEKLHQALLIEDEDSGRGLIDDLLQSLLLQRLHGWSSRL